MRVIVTAAGGPGGRFVTECLQAGGLYVIGVDANPLNLRHSGADKIHLIVRADDLRYCGELGMLAEGTNADVVLAQSDPEAHALAAWSEKNIPEGAVEAIGTQARFLTPSREAIVTAQDKWAAWQVWDDARIPQPKALLIPGWFGVAELDIEMKKFGRSIWLRARRGVGGQKAIHTRHTSLIVGWLNHYQLWGEEMLACEYIPGHNCVCDMVYFRGTLAGWCGRKVLSWQMAAVAQTGVSGASAVSVMWNDLELRAMADKAVRALMPEPHGIFGVDTMLDAEGRYWVTEVNAGRFNAPGPGLYLRAGRNLPLLAVICAVEQKIPMPERWRPETLPPAYAMVRTLDKGPLYLTKREWDELEGERWA